MSATVSRYSAVRLRSLPTGWAKAVMTSLGRSSWRHVRLMVRCSRTREFDEPRPRAQRRAGGRKRHRLAAPIFEWSPPLSLCRCRGTARRDSTQGLSPAGASCEQNGYSCACSAMKSAACCAAPDVLVHGEAWNRSCCNLARRCAGTATGSAQHRGSGSSAAWRGDPRAAAGCAGNGVVHRIAPEGGIHHAACVVQRRSVRVVRLALPVVWKSKKVSRMACGSRRYRSSPPPRSCRPCR